MGKLLQKIVNGIVPSWITRVRSSAHASPKKLLPFSRGDTSIATSFASDSILDYNHSDQSSRDEMTMSATAWAESGSVHSASSLSMRHEKMSMKQKDGKHVHSDDDDHHQQHDQNEDDIDHHHLHHPNMEECIPDMHSHATQIHALNLGDGIPDESHRPRHFHHRHPAMESLNFNDVLLGCVQEDKENNHRVCPAMESLNFNDVLLGCVQEDKENNHRDCSHDAHNGHDQQYDAQQTKDHNLLGFKRKGTYSEDEEMEGCHGNGNMKGSGWKRRKKEEGLMSCKLPKSVCRAVGNGSAVVKYSQEPHLALWESMVEMIVGNGLWEIDSLEFLLYCYLTLNDPHLYPIIQSSFLQVLKDLGRTF